MSNLIWYAKLPQVICFNEGISMLLSQYQVIHFVADSDRVRVMTDSIDIVRSSSAIQACASSWRVFAWKKEKRATDLIILMISRANSLVNWSTSKLIRWPTFTRCARIHVVCRRYLRRSDTPLNAWLSQMLRRDTDWRWLILPGIKLQWIIVSTIQQNLPHVGCPLMRGLSGRCERSILYLQSFKKSKKLILIPTVVRR